MPYLAGFYRSNSKFSLGHLQTKKKGRFIIQKFPFMKMWFEIIKYSIAGAMRYGHKKRSCMDIWYNMDAPETPCEAEHARQKLLQSGMFTFWRIHENRKQVRSCRLWGLEERGVTGTGLFLMITRVAQHFKYTNITELHTSKCLNCLY